MMKEDLNRTIKSHWEDEQFRKEFKKDPRATLKKYGVNTSEISDEVLKDVAGGFGRMPRQRSSY